MFLLLEGALRLCSYGSDYDLVARTVEKGTQYYYLNPSVGKRYFDPARYFLPKVERTLFEAEKSPRTLRIFCLGASTTAGFPYSYNLTPSFLLKKQLESALPGRRIEVINAGLTATSSYTVVEFVRELADYKPDLFVIYTGQNEFYGALGVGSSISIGQYRWLTKSYLALRQLKTFVLFEESLTSLSHAIFGKESSAPTGTLMQQMAKDKAIALNSPAYRRAMDAYRKNIEEALDIAGEHGIPVVLSTLVTNERALEPFVSIHRDDISEKQKMEVDALRAAGERLQSQAEDGRALEEFRKAAALDPGYAIIKYRMGQCFDHTGAIDSARAAYAAARDLDGLRFRASAEANRIVRSMARASRVVVADVDSAFRAHSPDGIPGKELLWEHVHPTLDGYYLLSQTWFKAMGSMSFQPADVNEKLRAAIPDSVLRASIGSTELDAEFGAQTMRKLLHRWPFESAVGVEEPGLSHDPIERAAALFINGTLRWNESHYELADAYLKDQQYARALREYKAVNSYDPDDPFPLTRMGDMYALLGNNELAAGALLRVLEITENQFIHLKLGVLYAKSGKSDLALVHLSSAFELDSHSASHFSRAQFAEATYYYAFALFKSGKIEEAKQTLAMLMENDPANARSAQLWAQINKAAGR